MSRKRSRLLSLLPFTALKWCGSIEFRKVRKASLDPAGSQESTLRKILRYGRDTEFGRIHGFSHILEAGDRAELYRRYRESVPASDYEYFRHYVNRMKEGTPDVLFKGKPVMYATTSGSTGEPKWIPVSRRYLKKVYRRMNRCWIYEWQRLRPGVYSGKILSVVGKTVEGRTADGTAIGSVSGFTLSKVPRVFSNIYSAPSAVFGIRDYTARNYAIMRIGIEQDITLLVTPNPSTLLELQHNVNDWLDEYITDIENGTLTDKVDIPGDIRAELLKGLSPNPGRAEELRQLRKKHSMLVPRHFWPNLKILCTWKCGNTQIYVDKIRHGFPKDILHQEMGYFSSECRAGLVLDDSDETVLFPHLHFYEFRKADQADNPDAKFLTLDELVPGERYCPFVTTFSGLYRYNMNDIVEASAPLFGTTPRIHMVQKVNGIVTITGEKLYESQFIDCVNRASRETGLGLNYFTAYANLKESRYDWYFEFSDESVNQKRAEDFSEVVDAFLKETNIEYAAKRDSNRLKAPATFRLQKQSFDSFKEAILSRTRRDPSRFKPNVLAQNEERHDIISQFILKSGLKRKNRK
ncbi:MAG: GH3 auxin-responsive promoter family protein [Bacteroidales bacterium]|nr:GH3 auxin-responsive promoter family protein [Bacteroidales bacterium]